MDMGHNGRMVMIQKWIRRRKVVTAALTKSAGYDDLH
jgi:hypothetical protein